MFVRSLTIAIIGLGPVLSAPGQIPPGYEIVRVTNDKLSHAFPRINSVGQIVFTSRLGFNNTTMEVFLYDVDGTLTQLTDNNVRDGNPVINDAGIISWSSDIGDGETAEIMVRSPDGITTRLTTNSLPDRVQAINSVGQICWWRLNGRGCAGAGRDLMFFDGESIHQITDNDWDNQSMDLNDRGQILFAERDFCPRNWRSLIKLYSDGVITTLSEEGLQAQGVTINNNGVCAWQFFDPATGDEGIQTWENGVRTLFTEWGSNPRLNDRGDMYFIRWHDDSSTWQAWAYLNAQFHQLTDTPFWNTDGDINNAGEACWLGGGVPMHQVWFMRRFPAGDLNCDGAFDGADIDLFFFALRDRTEYEAAFPECDWMLADMNGDNAVDGADIDPFFVTLGAG